MQLDPGAVARFRTQLRLALAAHLPVIAVPTTEEARLINHIRAAAPDRDVRQFTALGVREAPRSGADVAKLLYQPLSLSKLIDELRDMPAGTVVVATDVDLQADLSRQATRALADFMSRPWQQTPVLVLAHPDLQVPADLADDVHVLEMPLPDRAELAVTFDEVVAAAGLSGRVDPQVRDSLVGAALGLRVAQARRTFITSVVDDGTLDADDISQVLEAKRRIITSATEAVDIVDSAVSFDQVGGMDTLKNWVAAHRPAFTFAARAYGIPAPKGLVLIGVPGAGKSLAAKAIASELNSPLVRMDVGALFNRYVGESEARVRAALRLAETIAPCVLWIDELDRALAESVADGDGTTSRVIGTVLHWLAEKVEPVFVVATANRVSNVPKELLRRGRFDEVFFVDLPDHAARCEIVAVHLIASGRRPDHVDVHQVASATDGFVGSEIAQVVNDGLIIAFNDQREVTTSDLLVAARTIVPLSAFAPDELAQMRRYVTDGRVISAG